MPGVLVTGGAGFMGSNFVRRLRTTRPEVPVVVLDKLTYAGSLENLEGLDQGRGLEFVKGDVCDPGTVGRVFGEYDIGKVVHFAAESHVDRSIHMPGEFMRTNVMGTYALAEEAKKRWAPQGFKDRLFVQVSTDEVYGSVEAPGRFTEESAYRPNSPYAASKAASDHLVRSYNKTYGLPVATVYGSNNYGPHQYPEKLIPLMIINSLEGRALPVYGDGTNVRDWVHVSDFSAALELVMEKGRAGESYNVAGGQQRTNLDVVNSICEAVDELTSGDPELGQVYPFQGSRKGLITFVEDRPGHDARYALDCTKIKRELGWAPVYDFTSGIRETVAWYARNRPWWEGKKGGASDTPRQ